MTLQRWDVPDSWAWVSAVEVARIVGGGTPSSKDDRNFTAPGTGIPWIGPADLTAYNGTYIARGRRDLTEKGLAESGATLLPKGAVLFSSRAPIGYCVIAANEISTNQGFKSWVTADGIIPEFVRHYLRASGDYVESLASGTTFREVSGKRVESVAFPLPSTSEQRRIVAKLDALTVRIARTKAELDRVPILARKMREQAVRSAFRGELTNKSRVRNLGEEVGQSNDLPAGWRWCTLGDLVDIKSGLTLGKKRPAGQSLVEVPYIRVANVQRGGLNLTIIKEVAATENEIEALLLQPGDILLNEGGDRDKLGRGWVWEGQIPVCIHQNHVFRARLRTSENSPYYVSLYANEFGQDYFFEHGTQTTNLASISKSKVASLPVPVAPPAEQREIVGLLQSAFARADRLEAEAARARSLLDRLESAILAKAFRGELVPQDPDDEPASVLLERIRAQRAASPKPKRGRRSSKQREQ